MKVLRIYDHLGELKKELNLYVEGEDFGWVAPYPEVIWLGTIVLVEPGKEPGKPSEVVSGPLQPELETAEEADEELYGGKWNELMPKPEVKVEEVKDEPKSHDRKRSRVKRSTPSASPESTKGLRQDDSGVVSPKGDRGFNLA